MDFLNFDIHADIKQAADSGDTSTDPTRNLAVAVIEQGIRDRDQDFIYGPGLDAWCDMCELDADGLRDRLRKIRWPYGFRRQGPGRPNGMIA